jgi:hypothetical protein
MTKKKSKTGKVIGKTGRFFYYVAKGSLRDAYHFARFPEKKVMLDRKLEVEKRTDVHEDRIKRVERLIYSMFNDPSYSKSNKGQDDIKEIRRNLE